MTELLKQAINRLQELPDEAQDRVAALILENLGAEDGHASEKAGPADERPIWEAIQERTKYIPDEAWNEFPTDGAAEHDHYICGTLKKQI